MHLLEAAFRRLSTSLDVLAHGWRDGRARPAWDHASADLRRAVASWLASARDEQLALEAFGCALVISEMIESAGRAELAAPSALMMADRDCREVIDRMEVLIVEAAFDDTLVLAPPAPLAEVRIAGEINHAVR